MTHSPPPLNSEASCIEILLSPRANVTTAFPMGLPEFDPVRLTIEGEYGLEGTQAGTELLDAETAGLWMAGKEFRRDQAVGDRVGHNEKTRVTCKLQKPGSGPPGREPAVSEDERKAMMAFYFKRQEELKRLAEVSLMGALATPPPEDMVPWHLGFIYEGRKSAINVLSFVTSSSSIVWENWKNRRVTKGKR